MTIYDVRQMRTAALKEVNERYDEILKSIIDNCKCTEVEYYWDHHNQMHSVSCLVCGKVTLERFELDYR